MASLASTHPSSQLGSSSNSSRPSTPPKILVPVTPPTTPPKLVASAAGGKRKREEDDIDGEEEVCAAVPETPTATAPKESHEDTEMESFPDLDDEYAMMLLWEMEMGMEF